VTVGTVLSNAMNALSHTSNDLDRTLNAHRINIECHIYANSVHSPYPDRSVIIVRSRCIQPGIRWTKFPRISK
jgi:hypothetical protein